MAHKVAGGSRAAQKGNVAGKRLGVKIYGGQIIKTGQIILRQRGSKFLASLGVGMGKDFTLFAMKNGVVKFSKNSKGRTVVCVDDAQ